jgi:hypothetical protein
MPEAKHNFHQKMSKQVDRGKKLEVSRKTFPPSLCRKKAFKFLKLSEVCTYEMENGDHKKFFFYFDGIVSESEILSG